jgi:hypothetical protein
LAGSWVWWFKPQEDRVSAYPEFVEEVSRIRYFHPDGKLHCSCPAYCAAGSG